MDPSSSNHDEINIDNQSMGDGNGNRGLNSADTNMEIDEDKNISACGGISNRTIGDSTPSARRIDAIAGQHLDQMIRNQIYHSDNHFSHTTTNFAMNGSSKIEAPTSQNIEPYLNSLAQRTENNLATELDRKLPPSTANNVQQNSRGRQRHRNDINDFPVSDGFVPLRFVHVPNNKNVDALERAPSVPDLISYLHNHQREERYIPLLSDETLRDKERESRKEQFEARLRRAHLRLNSDAASVTRYRSKSTPSRGGMWLNESQSESGNAKLGNEQTNGHYSSNHGAPNGETNLIHANLRQFETTTLGVTHSNNIFHAMRSVQHHDSGFGSSLPAALVTSDVTPGEHNISSNIAGDMGTSNNILANTSDTSVKSSDGSHRMRTLSGVSLEGHAILEPPPPPPPPPPATEKERLVERERQGRLEAERARRRHIALLRERHLEESGDVVDNEGSDNVGLLGQVSFDGGLQPAPAFVGDNALVLELPAGNSSVGSSIRIPRPPLPPPPATERERLVERERQARLETERARRRHLALQRERQDDAIHHDMDMHSMDGRIDYGNSILPATSLDGVLTTLPLAAEEDDNVNSNVGYRQAEVQNADEANSLSYPMERFLERVDDEGPVILPIDSPAADNDPATLPYTMELFLADNVVVGDNSSNVRSMGSIGGSDIHVQVGKNHQVNDNSTEPLVATPVIEPNLDSDTNLNETPSAPIEWSGDVNDLVSSSGSVASIDASTNRGSLDDNENVQNTLTENRVPIINSGLGADFHVENSWVANTNSSPSRTSIAPSHESFNTNHHPSRLTEADIAQLAEVEHASIGNAPPQSERDEPSESSVVGRGAFLDHAFSIATHTTVIESVTEASQGLAGSTFRNIIESTESFNVIQVGTGGLIQASTSTSGGASSASIEAMPSSDDTDNMNHPPSISHSMAPSSHPSFDELRQMPRLTEADIVTMADIDYASVGNAPPASVRDERLSESSVTERSGRQFGIATPITEISSVDEHIDLLMADNSNTSDHSDNSIEVMPSEHGDRDRMNDTDHEMIVYQASTMGSSASIEALPSIDLENEIGLHNYGAISAENVLHDPLAEELTMDGDGCQTGIETTPLIPLRHEEQAQSPPDPRNLHSADSWESRETKTPNKLPADLASLIVLAIAELPTFIIIIQGGERLCPLLGMKRYHILLASLVVVTSILNYSSEEETRVASRETGSDAQPTDWSFIFLELSLGFLIGLIGFIMSELDIWFGTGVAFAIAAATIVSRLCKTLFKRMFQKLNPSHRYRIMWTGPVMIGCQDSIRCLIILQVTYILFSVRPLNINGDDGC